MNSHIYKHDRLAVLTRKGFTLLELAIVIGIGAIVLAMLAMAVAKARAFAREKANESLVNSIVMGLDSYKTDLGGFPGSFQFAEIRDDSGNLIRTEQWYGCQALAQVMLGGATFDDANPNSTSGIDGYDGYGFRIKKRGKVYGPYLDPQTPTKLIDNKTGEKRAVLLDHNENPIYYYRAQVGSEPRFIYDHNPDDNSEFLDAVATRFSVTTANVVDVYAMRTDKTDVTDRVDLPEYLICSKGVDETWWPAGINDDDDLTNLVKEE